MKEIRAEIITIGNELLAGYTVNTNATFISQQLLLTGLSVSWVTTIRDDAHEILTALETAGNRAEVVLISGGLGPTPDDITKQTICSYFDTELVFDESVFENIRNILQRRKLHLLESNRKQALVPASAEIIQNGAGTAPGLILKKKGTTYIFMPGVPQELQLMMQNTVPSYLKSVLELPSIHTHLLRTTGITEAGLYEQIRDIVDNEDRFPLSFLPRGIGVDLRLRLFASEQSETGAFHDYIGRLKERIGKYVFTEDDITMQEHIGNLLRERSLTLAIAESFTGGRVSDWITDIPGSSDYFMGGMVAYSNQSKMELLGVREETLKRHGAVSRETVLEILQGIRERFGTDCAIATTGIAGPGGGTEQKPVGLCFVAACCSAKERARKFIFGNNRQRTKSRGAMASLELLRRVILEIE